MAVSMLYVLRASFNDRVRDNRCAKNDVPFCKQYSSQKIKMASCKITDCAHLAGLIIDSHSAPFDLIALAILRGSIDVCIRIPGLNPAERFAEQVLGEVAGGIVCAAGN